MIEFYLLEQFIAFVKAGTLSKAAEDLHLSQPALSRNMKKLEDDLGVKLFNRTRNKMELNDNGHYFFEHGKRIMEESEELITSLREYDRKNRTISLGVCSPAPLWILTPLINECFPHMNLQSKSDDENQLLEDLDRDLCQLIVLHEKPSNDSYYCKECGKETLMFAVPKNHKYAKRKSLSFEEMNGQNMLQMANVGFWSFVADKMPDSRFLLQDDRYSLSELIEASNLSNFATDLSIRYLGKSESRIYIPVSDPEAEVTYYLVCKKENRNEFSSLFSVL